MLDAQRVAGDLSAFFSSTTKGFRFLLQSVVLAAGELNNAGLNAPLRDDHAIEITLACLFLGHTGNFGFALDWIDQIALSSFTAYRLNGHYPCVYREYSDLAFHPKPGAEYRKDATIGSVLYPSLAVWAALLGDDDLFGRISAFKSYAMGHNTWQLWVPDDISEQHLYVGSASPGAAISGFPFSEGGAD
jgi:hypothetical protein